MDLNIYIKELLFSNDCIIIPGFGAFVLNYTPANINSVSNTFYPPFKEIIFNQSLNRNDGLLASYVSKKRNITYNEALLILNDAVEDLKINLSKGKKITFNGIGNFKINKEGNYIFESDEKTNFYLESYGLTNFVSPTINRHLRVKKIEKTIKLKSEKKSIKYISAAAAIIILLISIGYLINMQLLDNLHIANANFFDYFNKRIYVDKATTEKSNEPLSIYMPEKIVTTNDNPIAVNNDLNKLGGYYIIGGCFGLEENAEKFMNELKSKGYKAQVIGKTNTGLIRVAYMQVDDKDTAEEQLSQIQSSENKGAWLLHL